MSIQQEMNSDRRSFERQREEIRMEWEKKLERRKADIQKEADDRIHSLEDLFSSQRQELHAELESEKHKWQEKLIDSARLHESALIEHEAKSREQLREFISKAQIDEDAAIRALREQEVKVNLFSVKQQRCRGWGERNIERKWGKEKKYRREGEVGEVRFLSSDSKEEHRHSDFENGSTIDGCMKYKIFMFCSILFLPFVWKCRPLLYCSSAKNSCQVIELAKRNFYMNVCN